MRKKLIKQMLLLAMICMSQTVVYAETMQLIYDGEVHSYNNEPITLFIDGNQITTTVMPPIQFDGSVVVPAREVFSVTGANIEWRPSEQSVYVHNETNLIVLKMDSNEAWVNGEIKPLNMPAKLINDKVMIPVRFISETLGYKVDWSQTERAIRIETTDYETDLSKPNDSNLDNDLEINDGTDIKNDQTDVKDDQIPTVDSGENVNGLPVTLPQLETWINSEYIHYESAYEALILDNIEALDAKSITVEENYHDKQIVIHLNNGYSSYLEAGVWEKSVGAITKLQITHNALETQITLTTSTIQALIVEEREGKIALKVVKPSSKYSTHALNSNKSFPRRIMNWNKCWP